MKRFFALTLALIMLMSLAACGNSTAEPNVSDNVAAITETETPDEIPTETPATSETMTPEKITEATNETEADTPTFDTSWASNEFEALIPKPPFDAWEGSLESDGDYHMLCFLSMDRDDDGMTEFAEYIRSLADYGFNLDDDDDELNKTNFYVGASNGDGIKLKFQAFPYMFDIWIRK